MHPTDDERVVRAEIRVDAGIDEVWDAWTTANGIRSFFAPACNVELRVNGAYEMFFDPDTEPGMRGGEGMRILALQPKRMLSFTWNAPPHLPTVRPQRTHVVVRLQDEAHNRTRVTLVHDGWGEGDEWNQAFAYFDRAWALIVLPRLRHRFAVGPIDWDNPPSVQP